MHLTPKAARAILARETDEVFLACLTITAGETMRLVNNSEPIQRARGLYLPYAFDAKQPEDTESANPSVTVTIDNVDREVTRLIREYNGIPTCDIEWIIASEPDEVQCGPFSFSVLEARYDAMVISINLGYEEDFLNQAVPAQTYSPTNSPGLFV